MKLFNLSVMFLSACTWLADRELEEFEETSSSGETTQSASGTVGAGGTSTVASSVASSASSGAGGAQCGLTPVVMPGACPVECTAGCYGDVCHIQCAEEQACKDMTIQCPPGWPCEIECLEHQSCEHAVFNCPADFTCIVRCLGSSACVGGSVFATTGVLEVTCSSQTDSCKDLEVECGDNACRAQCLGETKPEFMCGAACECSPCP